MSYFVKNIGGVNIFESKTAQTLKEGVQEAATSGAHLGGADLRGADLGGADLRGAYLRGAYLRGAHLGGADLRGADLRGAYLGGAYLRGADLRGADLGGADLGGADLGGQWIIQGQIRSDGYAFFLQRLTADTEPMVKAGCRHFTLAEAQAHWEHPEYRSPALAQETRIIVHAMIKTMHLRGLK